MGRRLRPVALMLVWTGLLGLAAALAGDLPMRGVWKGKLSPEQIEDGLLRADLETLRGVRARTALWVFAAESRQDWDRVVAQGLDEALSTSPDALARFARGLPEGIKVLGPDIGGARVRFDLPGDRGKGAVALHLPPLIKQGNSETSLLNTRVPNQGRFLSAIDLRRSSEGSIQAAYAPSRPRPLVGAAPSVSLRDVPGEGRGDLVFWAGRVGAGSDAEELREELKGWIGRDDLPTQPMRSFPGSSSELARDLRSMRVPLDVISSEEGWYRALSTRPESWELERTRVKHPARIVSGVAPVALRVDGQDREAVIGFVALYEPLLLTPEEAALSSGADGRSFFAAVHRGELPFLRDRDAVWFLRAHVARWVAGEDKEGSGKARTFRDAVDQLRKWADRYRLRGAEKIARGVLPFRYEPIPENELAQMVDRDRAARGRVYTDDLAAWVRHFDESFDQGEQQAAYVLSRPLSAADLSVTLRAAPVVRPRPTPEPVDEEGVDGAVAAVDPEPAPGKGGLVKASDVGYSGASGAKAEDMDDLDLDSRGWESSSGEETGGARYGVEAGRMGGVVGGAAEQVLGIALRDLYTVSSVCRIGSEAEAGAEVRVTGLGEDETAPVRLEWDLRQGGRSLRRDSLTEERGDGVHEIEFAVPCPDSGSEAELLVAVYLGDRSDQRSLPLTVRSSGGRSYAKLSMPAAKRCISADMALDSDEDFGMATSEGLSAEQIGAAVRGFQEQTLRCFSEAAGATGTVQVELTVGCDGRVSAVELIDETVGEPAFVACVVETMGYAPFPAHDREGGVVFELPLRYE